MYGGVIYGVLVLLFAVSVFRCLVMSEFISQSPNKQANVLVESSPNPQGHTANELSREESAASLISSDYTHPENCPFPPKHRG